MPFSILSEFKHTREAEQRERARNPRNVARKGGGMSAGEERESPAHRNCRHNVVGRKAVKKKIQMHRKIDRQIAPN